MVEFEREIGTAETEKGTMRFLAGFLQSERRPIIVELAEKIREAKRPICGEIDNCSNFLRISV
jgi:hypothetical protein